jgi:hypothetical protein
MPRVRRLDRVHRQGTNGVRHRRQAGGIERHPGSLQQGAIRLRADPFAEAPREVKASARLVPERSPEVSYQQGAAKLCVDKENTVNYAP